MSVHYLVKLEMLIAYMLPLSCLRKQLQNLSHLNCGLQIRQIWIRLITECGEYCKRRCSKVLIIGVARKCTGCTCTPRTEKKILGPNLQGKVVVHPGAKQEFHFWGNCWDLDGERGYLGIVLSSVLRATTKKRLSTFLEQKSAPQTKFWLRLLLITDLDELKQRLRTELAQIATVTASRYCCNRSLVASYRR